MAQNELKGKVIQIKKFVSVEVKNIRAYRCGI